MHEFDAGVLGFTLILVSLPGLWRLIRSSKWTVIKPNVTDIVNKSGLEPGSNLAIFAVQYIYKIEYEIEGAKYRSDLYTMWNYGEEIKIKVNPYDPKEKIISNDYEWFPVILLGIGCVAVIINIVKGI